MLVRLPEWQSVALEIVESNPKPGTLYTHEDLRILFWIKPPVTIEDYKENQFQYLECIENLRQYLLQEAHIALRVVPKVGYEVVAPQEQTQYGVAKGLAGIRKSIRHMSNILTNIRLHELTDAQVKENTDARVHAAGLASMVRKSPLAVVQRQKLPSLEDKGGS